MSTILIAVPKGAVCEFLHVVLGIHGHRHLDYEAPGTLERDLDAAIVDPSRPDCLDYARELRRTRPGLPIICVSAYRPSPEAEDLLPLCHLKMPFRIAQLENALKAALG